MSAKIILILHENSLFRENVTKTLLEKNIPVINCVTISDFLMRLKNEKPCATVISETIYSGDEKTDAIFKYYYPDDPEIIRGFSLVKYLRKRDLFPKLSSMLIFFTTISIHQYAHHEVNGIIGSNGAHWNLMNVKNFEDIYKKIAKMAKAKK